ncbi:hypothetical protein [Pseudomonas syringae]|uniref:hypothetical protein n=1 Tax=Pseudomonas syringae TaxID=317 RepID=UPI0006CB7E60|nr:hypothetical protein [Pseudomonas syringae]ALE01046.1 hypothetical protein PSYRMG_25285 [Pseudomonas syringae UMAF0158]MCK9731912.1 hypothetical protein [Pseudomonas syringae pv. syringae]
MAKIVSLATISTEFGIDPNVMESLGIIDTQLTADTNLFIDPLLLIDSEHHEMNTAAATAYEQRFEFIVKLLAASKVRGDVPWRNVEKLFNFSEVSWTCLGYSSSVRGAGFGKELTATTLDTAYQIVQLGITDVDFFMGLSLFEDGIGPDRISDMTTNIIIKDLIAFTQRINLALGIPQKTFRLKGLDFEAPVNPYDGNPLLFVPKDIVRELPIATDYSDISRVVKENEDLRDRVNQKIGGIWSNMTKRDRAKLKIAALKSKEAFEQLLEAIREVPLAPYDFQADRNGEVFWAKLLNTIAVDYPFKIVQPKGPATVASTLNLIGIIIKQFQDLVENKGVWKELWTEQKKPRKEKAAQRLFFVVAHAYCKANDLDITPEADTGNGPVDFKFSKGFDIRVVVEIKLSTNTLSHGYEKQLETYKRAEDTKHGIYLVIDVGGIGQKYNEVQRLRLDALARGERASSIYLVDGNMRASASKRK